MENKDYLEIENIVKKNNKLSLKELCNLLKGHNFDSTLNMFDLNWKSIVVTIKEFEGEIIVSEDFEGFKDEY